MNNSADRTDEQNLRSLERDERLSRLDRFVPPLQVIGSLGVGRDEVAHSRLLAALLDPRRHRGAETMLHSLLRGILRLQNPVGSTGERIRTIVDETWTRVDVRREFKFIDIVLQIASSRHTVVVGIENKIDSGEEEEQLGRYQKALQRAYPGHAALMVFLTPTGREPTTAIPHHSVPTVSVGYDLFVKAAEEALREAEPGSRDEHALSEIVAHLKENILGEDTKVKELVRDLWRSHGKALRLAMEHRPRLEDIRELYEALLRERFGNDAYTYYWPPRGEPREIKMSLRSWENAGLPFEFVLHVDGDGLALVRLLLWVESYDAHAASLREWARKVNASDPGLIDGEFPKLPYWGTWRRVLREEDYPADAVLNEQAFDEATAREAVEAVVALFEKLQPHIGTSGTG